MLERDILFLVLGLEIGFLIGAFFTIYTENKRIDNSEEKQNEN